MSPAGSGLRSPLTPPEAVDVLSAFRRPWWIAGGWAIDLFLGFQSRDHEDLDVEILRRDQLDLRRALDGWDLRAAVGGGLFQWPEGHVVLAHANSVWAREDPSGPWRLQVLLARSEGDRWLFRRDPGVSRRVSEVGALSPEGIPYLVPEIELLFKAKEPRPRDEQDFAAAVTRMDPSSRRWLRDALEAVSPGHPWIDRLG